MKSKHVGSLLKHQINKMAHAVPLKTHIITPVLMPILLLFGRYKIPLGDCNKF